MNCSQLLQRYRKREPYLEVDLGHVNEFRPDLLDMLTLRPVEYLPLFEQVHQIDSLRSKVFTFASAAHSSSGTVTGCRSRPGIFCFGTLLY